MARGLKQITVRTLLLVAKSFIYFRQVLGRIHAPLLRRAFHVAGSATLYAALWLVSPLYRQYRRVRRAASAVFAAGPSPLLKSLSHRFVLHAFVLLVAALTATANLATAPAGAQDLGTGSLIFGLVETDEALPVDLPVLPSEPAAPSAKPEPKAAPLARTYLSYAGDIVFQPYLPTTEDSLAPRQEILEYVVEAGDTPAGIAAKFRLQLPTLLLANNLSERSIIRPGQKLTILPVDGLLHTVRQGERIAAIAQRYRVTAEAILSFNRLPDARSVLPGQRLIIPGGRPIPAPAPPRAAARLPVGPVDTTTRLLWPGTGRRITQYFTWRHSGLDIGLPYGSPVYAAEDGVVLEARWFGGYGNMVLIRHDSGLVTRYGHNSRLLVTAGERVVRGQTIARVGSTGRSTGPHIHFEVYANGRRVNPLNYTR
jgi:murein DD-endopeptidase MepM/ murein hydrolase activator NlpD